MSFASSQSAKGTAWRGRINQHFLNPLKLTGTSKN